MNDIKMKLATLEQELNNSLPGIATTLRDIHQHLKNDPDVVTLLSEEECCLIVRGLKKQTATEITTSALKSNSKSIKNLTVNDL